MVVRYPGLMKLGILVFYSPVYQTQMFCWLCKTLIFFRAANGIFAKVGRLASEEVILLKRKCLPVLLYGLEVCALDKWALQYLDFAFNTFFYEIV